MFVKLVHFNIIELQRPIGGLIFLGDGGWGLEHDTLSTVILLAIFDQTCNLTLPKNCNNY